MAVFYLQSTSAARYLIRVKSGMPLGLNPISSSAIVLFCSSAPAPIIKQTDLLTFCNRCFGNSVHSHSCCSKHYSRGGTGAITLVALIGFKCYSAREKSISISLPVVLTDRVKEHATIAYKLKKSQETYTKQVYKHILLGFYAR